MTDHVNAYFRQFYPTDFDTNWEMEGCGGGWERRYQGNGVTNVFPLMKLADGLELSVQGHFGAYSYPRGDFEGEYLQVEIMAEPGIPELAEYERPCNACGDEMIYPYVPTALVNRLIEARGGLASDSGRLPKGEDSRSEAECEASQSGAARQSPNPSPQ